MFLFALFILPSQGAKGPHFLSSLVLERASRRYKSLFPNEQDDEIPTWLGLQQNTPSLPSSVAKNTLCRISKNSARVDA